jgi:hypothetical protein
MLTLEPNALSKRAREDMTTTESRITTRVMVHDFTSKLFLSDTKSLEGVRPGRGRALGRIAQAATLHSKIPVLSKLIVVVLPPILDAVSHWEPIS